MPDDSKPEQREAQQKHAAMMKLERGLQDATGLSRSQIHRALRAATVAVARQRAQERAKAAQVQGGPQGVKVEETKLEGRGLPLESEQVKGAGESGTQSLPDSVYFLVWQNSTLRYLRTAGVLEDIPS